MSNITDIVPFEHGSAYYLRRAAINRRQGKPEDALRLLRKASQAAGKAPDGDSLLEESMILSELGLFEAAGECITRALGAGCSDGKCILAMSENRAARGDSEDAEKLLGFLARLENASPYSEIAAGRLNQSGEGCRMPRRLTKGLKLLRRACTKMVDGDKETGMRLMNEASGLLPDEPVCHALWALTLYESKEYKAASETAEHALGLCGDDVTGARARCICAQVKLGLDDAQGAVKLLKQAGRYISDPGDELLYIQGLAAVSMWQEIRAFALARLAKEGFNKLLLHSLSLSACALKLDEASCLDGWNRILEFDPNSLECASYIKAYKDGTLAIDYPAFEYRVPHETMLKHLESIGGIFEGDPNELWRRDENIRALMKRLLYSEDMRIQSMAAQIIAEIDDGDPETEMLRNTLPFRADLGSFVRAAVLMFSEPGRYTEIIAAHPVLFAAGSPGDASMLEYERPWVKRLYLNAKDYLESFGVSAEECSLYINISSLLDDKSFRRRAMTDTDIAEAAICLICLRDRKVKVSAARVERDFRLRPRQLERMIAAIDRVNEKARLKYENTEG